MSPADTGNIFLTLSTIDAVAVVAVVIRSLQQNNDLI